MNKTSKIFKKFKSFLAKSKEFFCNLVFPENIKCAFCNTDIPNFDEVPYCENCAKTLPFNNGHRCEICDLPIGNEAKVCDFCQNQPRTFRRAFCPFVYQDQVRSAILAYKDSNRRYLAKPFARLIASQILQSAVRVDAVAFVPITKRKLKKRTFNQSQLLAAEIAKILNAPLVDIFEKTRESTDQKNLTYKQRREAVVDLYRLAQTPSENVKISKNAIFVRKNQENLQNNAKNLTSFKNSKNFAPENNNQNLENPAAEKKVDISKNFAAERSSGAENSVAENLAENKNHNNQNFEKVENLLIVDDIITTCATICACSALVKNRVQNVYVCAVAREVFRGRNGERDFTPSPNTLPKMADKFSCE